MSQEIPWVTGEGLSQLEMDSLRDQVEEALRDPHENVVIVTNYPVTWQILNLDKADKTNVIRNHTKPNQPPEDQNFNTSTSSDTNTNPS